MELCNKCIIYSNIYDKMGNLGNDTENPCEHFCTMFNDGIPNKITNDDEDCPYFLDKKDFEEWKKKNNS